ncbi:MAG TPA: hypothetical protein H9960_03430 [Candidatus Duodenibacillus intestinigallinarum]|nr:hypothetical protein [Candidatus Duodenibacillus intestinigallinarum]
MLDTQTSNRTEQALHEASKIADPIDLQSILWAGWNWDVGAEFRISIKKPELQGLRP